MDDSRNHFILRQLINSLYKWIIDNLYTMNFHLNVFWIWTFKNWQYKSNDKTRTASQITTDTWSCTNNYLPWIILIFNRDYFPLYISSCHILQLLRIKCLQYWSTCLKGVALTRIMERQADGQGDSYVSPRKTSYVRVK